MTFLSSKTVYLFKTYCEVVCDSQNVFVEVQPAWLDQTLYDLHLWM